ncbi:MAG: sulfur oxidation c-type cytochrome SoxA [Acetobacteraceae bacterium]|nr:sulfur oxidation c-type cytochrome SoxA [Acetobacteraceae bacterium]
MIRHAAVPILILAAFLSIGASDRRSGYDDASPETRAMQDDDAANPAFLWVKQGEALWSGGCANCHGDVSLMRGVAARYPAFDLKRDRLMTVEQRINLCRTDHMAAPAYAWDDDRLLALSALVGLQSRGMPLAARPREPFMSEGAALFRERMGQLNMSCAQCHEERAGQRLAGSTIPEGHPNGYPEYRLEWQGMGSLYRRLRNCLNGVRAEVFTPDSREAASLALFLTVRANGMIVETPAVRP